MDVKYVNPFLDAASDILKQFVGEGIQTEKPFIKRTPYTSDHLVVLIGVTGNINGQVIISFEKEAGKYIASKMMGGMEVTELDEMTKSAIGELCNMIVGNAATIFSQKELNVDVTPPTQLAGDNIEISHKNQAICIPVKISSSVLEINIVAEEAA